MTPTRKKQILYFLQGRDTRFLEKVGEPPTDIETKNLICSLSTDELRQIGSGPYGDRFRELTRAALQRIADEDLKGLPPRNGRTSGVLLDFEPAEVSLDLRPREKK